MRLLFITILFSLNSLMVFAQVGIGTTDPQATLDVNGNLRIRNVEPTGVESTELGGQDSSGTYHQVSVGQGLRLKGNELSSGSKTILNFGQLTLTERNNDNVDLLIGPGEANEFNNIIRVYTSYPLTKVSGMQAAENGRLIYLYPVDDKLDLNPEDTDSLPENRISDGSSTLIQQYEMTAWVYDGIRQRWINIEVE